MHSNDKTIIATLLAMLVGLPILAGCVSGTKTTQPDPDTVSRYTDPEYGVVCWTYQSGISCVPLKDTTQAR